MKVHVVFSLRTVASLWRPLATGLFALTLLMPATSRAAAAAAAASTPSTTSTNQVSTNQVVASFEIPQSVFVVPNSPREGRNPFFPGVAHADLPVTSKAPQPVDGSSFILNGITSPPKRTAMINGRTFEVGEEGEVHVAGGGKELIKCLDIGVDSATIESKGQRVQLRFHSSP